MTDRVSDNETRTWLAPTLLGVFLLVIVGAIAGGVALSSSSTASSSTATNTDSGTVPGSGSGSGSSASSSPMPSFAPGSPGVVSPPLHNGSPVPQESGIPIATNYTVTGDPTSNVLRVHTQRGGCQSLDIHLVSQSASEVVLFVKLSTTATTGTVACPMYIQIVDQPVTLDAPLGTRSVVDQSTGKTVPVS